MQIKLLLGLVLCLGIFLTLLICFFKNYGNKRKGKIAVTLFLLGLIYFILSIFYLFWFFGIFSYSIIDYIIIYSLGILIQTFVLFYLVFLLSLNKKIFYYLIFYILAIFSFFSTIFNPFIILIISSSLLSLLLFIYLLSKKEPYFFIAYSGIIYSLLLLLSGFFLSFNIIDFCYLVLPSLLLFFIICFSFCKNLERYPLLHLEYLENKQKSYIFLLLRHFIFIVILTNFVFIGTIGIHELGHFGVSKFYDCEYRKIIYEGDFPHTEVLCKNLPNENIVILGGVLPLTLISVFLLFFGGSFLKSISLLILGFNLIASNGDFKDLGLSDNLSLLSLLFGLILLIIGVTILAKVGVDKNLD